MLDHQPQALEIAAKVLQPETVREILNCSNLNYLGWNILDRWALNQADKLKELENNYSITSFLMIILEQQALEQAELDKYESIQLLQQGLTEQEILEQAEIRTALN